MKLKVNWEHKRARHAIERMWLRGISQDDILKALEQGQKRRQADSSVMESLYSYFSVVYDEYFYKKDGIRKVFPITVKLW